MCILLASSECLKHCAPCRPLLVQFCANDPATLLAAAKLAQGRADAIDLNLGCPQRIARRGRYGGPYAQISLPPVTCNAKPSASVSLSGALLTAGTFTHFPDIGVCMYAATFARACSCAALLTTSKLEGFFMCLAQVLF